MAPDWFAGTQSKRAAEWFYAEETKAAGHKRAWFTVDMTVTDGGKSEWSFWTATTSGINRSIILP
jgi:hypothetical protein